MNYGTVEVDIDHGRVVPREPGELPSKGSGLPTILEPASTLGTVARPLGQRAGCTDSFLAALAVKRRVQWVTFDQGFRRCSGLDLLVLA